LNLVSFEQATIMGTNEKWVTTMMTLIKVDRVFQERMTKWGVGSVEMRLTISITSIRITNK